MGRALGCIEPREAGTAKLAIPANSGPRRGGFPGLPTVEDRASQAFLGGT